MKTTQNPEQVAKEALVAMRALSYKSDSGARMVMPMLFQEGVHHPAVRRATRFAKIPPEQLLNVSRMIAPQDLAHWIERHRLLARDAVKGMVELYDDALHDFEGRMDPGEVEAAARSVKQFGKALRSTREEQFAEGGFPFHPSYRKYMTDSFGSRWMDPRQR